METSSPMIYAKIYLDFRGNVVFDSVQGEYPPYFSPATILFHEGKPFDNTMTRIEDPRCVIASKEAIETLKAMMDFNNPNLSMRDAICDFRFYSILSPENGVIAYKPERGKTKRVLRREESFSIDISSENGGFDLAVLDYVHLLGNAKVDSVRLDTPLTMEEILSFKVKDVQYTFSEYEDGSHKVVRRDRWEVEDKRSVCEIALMTHGHSSQKLQGMSVKEMEKALYSIISGLY